MRLGVYYRLLVCKGLNIPLSVDSVLDVGCHDGFLLSNINSACKVGIDLETRENYADIEYIKGNFLSYNFGDRRFKMILALDVLEHVEEDQLFLEKLVSLLSPRGFAIVSIPAKNIKIFPPFLQRWINKRWGHIYRSGYNTKELRGLINNEPQLEINIIEWNCPFFRFFYLPLSILWRVYPLLVKNMLNIFVRLDNRFRHGNHGFYFALIKEYAETAVGL